MNGEVPEGYSIYRASEGYKISFMKYGLSCHVYENGKCKVFRKEEKAIEYAKQHTVKRVAEMRAAQWVWCPFCDASVYIGDPLKCHWCEKCLTMFYVKGDKIWFDKSKESFANRAAKIARGDFVGEQS
jgi:hypothetical protein